MPSVAPRVFARLIVRAIIMARSLSRIHVRHATAWLGAWCALSTPCFPATYFIDAASGDDRSSGLSPTQAWKSLERTTRLDLQPGDTLLLAADQIHSGMMTFTGLTGTADAPIRIGSFTRDETAAARPRAVIDARGLPHAIRLTDARHVIVSGLILQADGGGLPRGDTSTMRCGVLVDTASPGVFGGITLRDLGVRDIFFEDPGFRRDPAETRTANGTQKYGWGIRFIATGAGHRLEDLRVEDCVIENTGHTGLKFTSQQGGIRRVQVVNNTVRRTGGPGIQLSGVDSGLFRGNRVDRSGHGADPRQWGRGSGLWTWGCADILIEHNRFTNARGPGDSAGCHIDFNCRNVIVQYNVSAHNAGGFCEILGNNFNCAYRYNLSVNDGHRVKGRDGAFQEGKILWLSGYVGDRKTPVGPFHSYIYNNTIHTSADIVAKIAFAASARGVLIANNIFHLEGPSALVAGDQSRAEAAAAVSFAPLRFTHNLFLRADNWPASAPFQDSEPVIGDPAFARPGGIEPADYVPSNDALIRDRGIAIEPLAGDPVGLTLGLGVGHDLLGRPIVGRPDLGAIELP